MVRYFGEPLVHQACLYLEVTAEETMARCVESSDARMEAVVVPRVQLSVFPSFMKPFRCFRTQSLALLPGRVFCSPSTPNLFKDTFHTDPSHNGLWNAYAVSVELCGRGLHILPHDSSAGQRSLIPCFLWRKIKPPTS